MTVTAVVPVRWLGLSIEGTLVAALYLATSVSSRFSNSFLVTRRLTSDGAVIAVVRINGCTCLRRARIKVVDHSCVAGLECSRARAACVSGQAASRRRRSSDPGLAGMGIASHRGVVVC